MTDKIENDAKKYGLEIESIEDILLNIWDANGNPESMMNAITKDNVNYKTKDDGWTPIMMVAGLKKKEQQWML